MLSVSEIKILLGLHTLISVYRPTPYKGDVLAYLARTYHTTTLLQVVEDHYPMRTAERASILIQY